MKKPIIHKKQGIIIAVCALALIVAGAYGYYSHQAKAASEEAVYTEANAEIGSIRQTLTATGEIAAAEKKNLIFNKSKVFKGMCAEVNEYVPAGEPLALYSDGTTLHDESGGVIAKINAPRTGKKGDGVQSLTLLTTDKVNLNLSVPEDEINRITPDQGAEVAVNGGAKIYQGTVTYIGGSSLTATKNATADHSTAESKTDAENGEDSATDTTESREETEAAAGDTEGSDKEEETPRDEIGNAKYTVVITLENDGSLRPGMSAECTVLLEQHDNIVIVPIAAVLTGSDGYYVDVFNGSTVEKTAVTTGISDAKNVEILSGLKGTEKLRVPVNGIDDKKAAGNK